MSGIQEFVFEARFQSGSCVPGAPQCLKIEFLDAQNDLATLLVQDLGTDFRQITVTPAQLELNNPDVDLNAIIQINFVLEGTNLEPNTGTVTVRSGDLFFTPSVSPEAALFTATAFPGSPAFTSFEAQGATGTIQTVLPSQFLYNYDLTAAGSFAGPIINYIETTAGSQDFSTAGAFEFNIRTNNACLTTKYLKIEFQDTTGQTAVVDVTGLTETFQGVLISRETLEASNPDLNLAAIRQINFVLEETNVNPKAGLLEVQTGPISADTPNPNPEPNPNPNPNKAPAGAIQGITENQTVSGEITVKPNLIEFPNIHKVFYYVDGNLIEKVYESPFETKIDTSNLEDGPHVLSGLFTVSGDEDNVLESLDSEFSITFTVNNGRTNVSTQTQTETSTNSLAKNQTDQITLAPIVPATDQTAQQNESPDQVDETNALNTEQQEEMNQRIENLQNQMTNAENNNQNSAQPTAI